MAASLVVEEECGRFTGFLRKHQGYHAGDFPAADRVGTRRLVEDARTSRRAGDELTVPAPVPA